MKITKIHKGLIKPSENEIDYVKFCSIDNTSNFISITEDILEVDDIMQLIDKDDTKNIIIYKKYIYLRELYKDHIVIYIDDRIVTMLKECFIC